MAVHGVRPAKGKTALTEPGDWAVKTNTGKPVADEKGKPLAGLSFAAAQANVRSILQRTGAFHFAVRG